MAEHYEEVKEVIRGFGFHSSLDYKEVVNEETIERLALLIIAECAKEKADFGLSVHEAAWAQSRAETLREVKRELEFEYFILHSDSNKSRIDAWEKFWETKLEAPKSGHLPFDNAQGKPEE